MFNEIHENIFEHFRNRYSVYFTNAFQLMLLTSCPAWPLNAASRRAPARRLIFGIFFFLVARGLTLKIRQQQQAVCRLTVMRVTVISDDSVVACAVECVTK